MEEQIAVEAGRVQAGNNQKAEDAVSRFTIHVSRLCCFVTDYAGLSSSAYLMNQ